MEKTRSIKVLRKNAGMTQEDLAQRLNVSYQAVGKWERGEAYPSAALLPALAEALHCSIDELYTPPEEESA